MTRTEIINNLIERFNYKTYLEIGVQNGVNYNQINCKYKVGVDPEPKNGLYGIYKMISDEFFEQNKESYDLIFIDGLHYSGQVHKDIINSLNWLNKRGTIVCHDMNPTNKAMQDIPRRVKVWTGNCWKTWVRLEIKNAERFVVDTDFGVGIIKPDLEVIVKFNDIKLSYKDLEENRKKLLNLITVQEFKNWLGC